MATSSTKYLKIETTIRLANDNAYSSEIVPAHTITEEIEVTRYKRQGYLAATGGTTVDLSEFGTIYKCLIRNLDASNYVDTNHDTVADGATSPQACRVFAEQVLVLTDVDPTQDLALTANGADCEVEIEVYGAA